MVLSELPPTSVFAAALLFRLRLPTGRWLMMTGEVTHAHDGAGFGVRFVGLPEMTQMALTPFIEHMRESE